MLKWLPPHRIKISSANPKKWGDFLWGAGFKLMVSEEFREIYEKEGLSGIREFSPPAEIVRMGSLKSGVFPASPPIYSLVDIPFDGANQDDHSSEVERYGSPRENYCPYHSRGRFSFKRQPRIIIEEGSWKGGDIFMTRGSPAPLLVTERFKQIAEAYQLKNLLLIAAEKYGYDDDRIPSWFINE